MTDEEKHWDAIKKNAHIERKRKRDEYRAVRAKRAKMFNRAISLIIVIAAVIGGISLYLMAQKNQKKAEFTFAYQDRVADAASIIAVEKGYFKDEGLAIIPRMFSSGPECTEALTSGSAEFGTMGDTTGIIVSAKRGNSFKIVCSHGGGEHRHRIIVSNGSAINSISDMEGKRIGVKKGTSTHGGLLLFAKKHGLSINNAIVDMSPSLQLTALAAGELDAIVASEPTPSQAEAGGYGHELATLGELHNTYPILLVVNSNFAEEHSEIVVKILKALIRARDFIKNNPERAAKIQSNITGLDAAIIKNAMSFHYYDVNMNDETRNSLRSMAEFLKRIGRINELPKFDKVIDGAYLKQVSEAPRVETRGFSFNLQPFPPPREAVS